MFDVGFPELVLVFVIGLLVLGPQRLPKVASEIGKWVGRARRTATQLRRQLEREIELSEVIQPPKPPPRPAPPPPAPGDGVAGVAPDPAASSSDGVPPQADVTSTPAASEPADKPPPA
jgi:Tat protein translocase TatB subunit